ncbi:response regulator transcription factor [Schaedlerella arabinosiphila]|uniref:Response regulator transcription factor n=1 Tax=Schaedlerella arabinosiphila TaxID=2044587 RepID=A0A9X5CCJ9_9FIRM|nr:response regulator transcription factor [Schaedlerella arabinosiphila]
MIIIVEDDSFPYKMLAYNLSADGYAVTIAFNTVSLPKPQAGGNLI